MSILGQTPIPESAEQGDLARQIRAMGEWFHNLNLRGVPTAPNHFLGDFPSIIWNQFSQAIPARLDGATVLDLGCNGGFYSIEFKRRGADYVLGIDIDDKYLNQARFAARTLDLDIDFRKCSVYELDSIPGQFDYVVFMGVFYHLRYPLLGLDLAVKKIAGQMIFQTMLRGTEEVKTWEADYPFSRKDMFLDPAFPAMYFVEKKYSSDPTNWWIPNCSAAEAILRSAGLKIVSHPEEETWICELKPNSEMKGYVVDQEFAGELIPDEDEGEQPRGGSGNAVE